ncbi:MAG TPA: hypothetical protein VFA23_04625 [Dongiaceae bacterium]|nr:hypothetical protein [Dongiaceae bacterium]
MNLHDALAAIGDGLGSVVDQVMSALQPALLPVLVFLNWLGPGNTAIALGIAAVLVIALLRRSARR